MLPPHIRGPSDLVTSSSAIVDGFLTQATAKRKAAAPIIERAKRFRKALESATNVDDLLRIREFRAELVAAAGISDKARAHLSGDDLQLILRKTFGEIIAKGGDDFRDEILLRYLLTKGDALGGVMRNLTGATASFQFANALIAALKERGTIATVRTSPGTGKVQAISWETRLVLFDARPKLIGKSIDVIALNAPQHSALLNLLSSKTAYLACGELKGGIDPAGADEHWKTANSALERIREKFKPSRPGLFFVGAAIEKAMADEIFVQLEDGRLDWAANLNIRQQVEDLAEWLVNL